jgi:hypothetical protein
MKIEQKQCSETSAIKHHTPGNNPKDYTQHLEDCESLKIEKSVKFIGQAYNYQNTPRRVPVSSGPPRLVAGPDEKFLVPHPHTTPVGMYWLKIFTWNLY